MNSATIQFDGMWRVSNKGVTGKEKKSVRVK